MRIAYFLTWHEGVGRGVLDKVNDQLRAWILAGHEVAAFVVTPTQSVSDLESSTPNIHTEDFRSPLGSLIAQIHSLDHIRRFAPDLIYLRPSLRNLWLLRFLPSAPLVAEIQSNDLLESKLQSLAKYHLTRFIRRSLKRATGLVFVSQELASAPEFANFSSRRTVIGNGIDLSRVTTANIGRSDGPPSLLFMVSSGKPWQGLDQLLALAQEKLCWQFHIVGDVNTSSAPSPNVIIHGPQDSESIRDIAATVDIGVGTLGLYRKGMSEASPLKVRYYLALGLPVVAAYRDTDIDPSCDYFLQIPNEPHAFRQSADLIEAFAYKWRGARIGSTRLESIDSSAKEAQRLRFLSRVLAEWRIASTGV